MTTPVLIRSFEWEEGVYIVRSNPGDFQALGGVLYFTAEDNQRGGRELWKTDGTPGGTVRVADIHRGVPELNLPNDSSNPSYLTAAGKSLFFSAFEPFSGSELWKTDGVATTRVADLFSGTFGSEPTQLTALGNRLFFNAFRTDERSKSLWVSDGTSKGTRQLRFKDGQLSRVVPEAQELVVFANQLYFTLGQHSLRELWRTDGTEAGTRIVKRLTPTLVGSFPQELTVVGRTLYFTAKDTTHGRELWKTDGTAAGTVRLDIGGQAVPSYPHTLTAVGGKLFFTADDRVNGRELWMTDGTSGGTRMVRDITPAILPGQIRSTFRPGKEGPGAVGTYPGQLVGVGSTLYFVADNGKSGLEIWKSDGTAKGTVLVTDTDKDVFGASSNPTALTPVGNTLFFQVNLAPRVGQPSVSVLKTDAVTGDISTVAEGTRFDNRQLVGSNLFFSDRSKLWKLDVSAELRTASNPAVQLSIVATASGKLEGREGIAKPFTFVVNRSGDASGVSTAAWSVAGTGSKAANGADFVGGALPAGTVSFASGETSRTITVNVRGDLVQEGDETFLVSLSAPTGASLFTASASGTILNDDLIGNSNRNTLVGTARAEFLDGRANVDILTGGRAADVFGFRFGESPLSAPDRITDFALGSDKIDLLTASGGALPAPVRFSRAANNTSAKSLGALAAAVFADANGALTGKPRPGRQRRCPGAGHQRSDRRHLPSGEQCRRRPLNQRRSDDQAEWHHRGFSGARGDQARCDVC